MYLTLVEKGNDGIVIIQDGLVKFANPKMLELSGFLSDEVIGRPFLEFVVPSFREMTADNYKRRLSGLTTPQRYEIEITTKDGSNIPLETNASIITYEGKPADMATVRDITERKLSEEMLRESEHKFRELFNNIGSCVAIYKAIDDGKDFILTDFNRAAEKVDEISRQTVIGRKVTEVFPGIINFGLFTIFQRVWKPVRPNIIWPQNMKTGESAAGGKTMFTSCPAGK
jgi:PAS domain S-box-containing protein